MDLGIFTNVLPSGETQLNLEFGKSGYGVAGIEKIAQFFTTFFLTDRGSVATDPEFGTDFMPHLKSGGIRTDSDVNMEFSVAVSLLLSYNSKYNIADDANSDDEIIASINLISYQLLWELGQLKLWVGITSKSGAERKIIVPIQMVAT